MNNFTRAEAELIAEEIALYWFGGEKLSKNTDKLYYDNYGAIRDILTPYAPFDSKKYIEDSELEAEKQLADFIGDL